MAAAHVLGWQAGCAGLLPADYLDSIALSGSEARWRGRLVNPAPATDALVAEVAGAVVGLASYGRSYDPDLPTSGTVDVGELYLLYVHPEHWGTGAGHRLHDAAMAALVDGGFTENRLWVVRGNERAGTFYRRHGWTADGATKTVADGAVRWVEERLVVAGRRPTHPGRESLS